MKKINGKAIRIHDPKLIGIDFFGLPVIPIHGGHREMENKGERIFQEANPTFIHWPVTFYFGRVEYTPDFYDPKTHTFFEIIGTSQRYYQGQNKILRLHNHIPLIKLMICKPNGEALPIRYTTRGKSKRLDGPIIVGGHLMGESYFEDLTPQKPTKRTRTAQDGRSGDKAGDNI